ncbi:MAG: hydroxymethylglutaryl-CoA lyase [Phycisphaerales bacterium]
MPQRVRITDVAPRDGLQNESAVVPVEDKVALIEKLALAGVDEVEITSFVRPDWVPQLADAAEVAGRIAEFVEGVRMVAGELPRNIGSPDTPGGATLPIFSALVPNERGLERLLTFHERGLDLKVSLFAAASETFSRKNTNASISEVLSRFGPVMLRAHEARLPIRVYVSCAVACPFEGPTEPGFVRRVVNQVREVAVTNDVPPESIEIDLADTIGVARPDDITALLGEFSPQDIERLTLHLHDTHGGAADCVRTALALGVRSFDGAAGGLGGCPFASVGDTRAPGNLATQTLVRTVHDAGYTTGVDMTLLGEAGRFAEALV